MNLKLTKYTNTPGTFEAVWYEETVHPEVVTPAVGVEGEEGYQPETIQPERIDRKEVRVTAYSGDQINLFRDDVAQYGGDISEWESLLAEIESEWVPPPVVPVEPSSTLDPIEKLKAFLAANPDVQEILK